MTAPLRLVDADNEAAVRSTALIQSHLEWVRVRGLRAATIKARRGALARTARKLPCPLIEVTADQLRQWQEGLHLGDC